MKATSTRGKRDAKLHPSLVPAMEATTAAVDSLRDNRFEEVRKLAQEHDRDALATLVDLMENRKTSPSVRRQCARDILEISLGAKIGAASPLEAAAAAGGGGLVINILNLTDGEKPEKSEERVIEAELATRTEDVLERLDANRAPNLTNPARDQGAANASGLPSSPAPAAPASSPDWAPSAPSR